MKTSSSILWVWTGLLLTVLLSADIARAQYFTLVFDTASGKETCNVLAATCLANNQEILNDMCVLQNFAPSVLGKDRGTVCYTHSYYDRKLLFPCKSKGDLVAGNRAYSNGYNTQSLEIVWKNTGRNWAMDDAFSYSIDTDMEFSTTFKVDGALSPVQVYYSYQIFGGGSTSHEAVMEDEIVVTNTFTINGNEVTGGAYNFASSPVVPGVAGWNQSGTVYGSVLLQPGQTFNVAVTSEILLLLNSPQCVGMPCITADKNDGIFKGKMLFTLTPQYPVIPSSGSSNLLFSLDIGSDHELMDIQQDGDETFDPGDIYLKSSTPISVSNGMLDDEFIFAVDPMPDPNAPIMLPPYHSGLNIFSISPGYFDLDGTDNTDFSLFNYFAPASLGTSGGNVVPAFDSNCIFDPNYMLISYDDDVAENYCDLAPALPIESGSPFRGSVYGNDMDRNEIYAYEFDAVSSSIVFGLPVLSEEDVHASLALNPLMPEWEDDDVDALDYIPFESDGNTLCTNRYFSADHEATYFDPITGNLLNPGSIYEALSSGGFVEACSPAKLGLPIGTDVDEFEFTFYPQYSLDTDGTITITQLLAIAFTVDDNDPATPDDESGGLDPAMIYLSFMNYSNFPLLSNSLDDDIDGITFWGDEFYSGLFCQAVYPDSDGDGYGDSGNPMNSCTGLPGYVNNDGDCNDTDPTVYPGAPGTKMGIDNNCDGVLTCDEKLPCQGDFNGDCVRNISDLLLFMASYSCTTGCGIYDLNGDGVANIADLLLFMALYGTSCP